MKKTLRIHYDVHTLAIHPSYKLFDMLMNHAATIQFRVNTNTKDKSFDVFKKHGLTLTDGLRIYLERVASLGEIPFSLNIPNSQTQKSLAESQAGLGLKHFSSADDMFAHLDSLTK